MAKGSAKKKLENRANRSPLGMWGESEDIASHSAMTHLSTRNGSAVHAASLLTQFKWLEGDSVGESSQVCDPYTERCRAYAQEITIHKTNARSA